MTTPCVLISFGLKPLKPQENAHNSAQGAQFHPELTIPLLIPAHNSTQGAQFHPRLTIPLLLPLSAGKPGRRIYSIKYDIDLT